MTLGTNDEQTACFTNLVCLWTEFFFELLGKLGKAFACFDNFFIIGIAETSCFYNQLFIVAFLAHLILCQEFSVTAQHNVGTTTSHVGCDGYRTVLTSLCNDFCFFLMIFCVEHLMLDAMAFEQVAQTFGSFDRNGTNQNWLSLFVAFFYLLNNCVEFSVFGFVYNVRQVFTDYRLVGWDLDNVHTVDLTELLFLGHCSTGHTGELFIHTEQVLVGDGSQSLRLTFYLNAFFCLDCLMQTFAVTASVHDTAGKFVYDHDFTVFYNVVDVTMHGSVCLDCLVDVMLDCGVLHVHQVFQAKEFLCLLNAGFGQGCGLCFLVYDVVCVDNIIVFFFVVQLFYLVHAQASCKAVCNLVQIGGFVTATGNDQRSSCFIDEDGVNLVYYCKVMSALNAVFFVDLHVVTQIVKTKLIVGTISNVCLVCFLTLCRLDIVDNQTYLESQPAVYLAHLFRVTFCKVIVDGNNMNTFSGQSV